MPSKPLLPMENKRNITLNFERDPEDNGNPAQKARAEWF